MERRGTEWRKEGGGERERVREIKRERKRERVRERERGETA